MHGGDIYNNKISLDFSVNLNPLGMPEDVREAIMKSVGSVELYPDPEYRKLRNAIGIHYGVNPERIVCGNGASELIAAVCRAFLKESSFNSKLRNPKALILAPGFTGYRYALSMVHADIVSFGLQAEDDWIPDDTLEETIAEEEPALVLLANPSNPTGVVLPGDRMARIAGICEAVGAVLCVDECFMELTDQYQEDSLIGFIGGGSVGDSSSADGFSVHGLGTNSFSNLVVLNAVTKTFCIPGIRMGYAFCSTEKLAAAVQRQIPEWNVSTLAETAAIAAFRTDAGYLREARDLIRSERRYLEYSVSQCGCHVYPSQANYLLFHSDIDLYHPLLQQGILIRDCSDYEGLKEGWYRIAVRKHDDNVRLVRSLYSIVDL